MGKSIKSNFLDSSNNLLQPPSLLPYTTQLSSHTKSIEKFRSSIPEIPSQPSILRISKHTWNVHQFYIDMLVRFLAWVESLQIALASKNFALENLEIFIGKLKGENSGI